MHGATRRSLFWHRYDAEIAAIAIIALVACTTVKQVGGEIGGAAVEYIACPVVPGLDCGHVFMCQTPADNPLGFVEICVDDDNKTIDALAEAEAVYGACEPTPRHQGICVFCPKESGCNAFNGCFNCPEEP